jgi:thiosulfate/3-mercaptopyruvate sulfurtransferase
MGAARLWWMLDALGVEAYVLDGGFQAYLAAGLKKKDKV